jgi:hypothetical protein
LIIIFSQEVNSINNIAPEDNAPPDLLKMVEDTTPIETQANEYRNNENTNNIMATIEGTPST